MRMLLFPSNSDECLALVNKLLDSFCKGCITLYGKGFLSYNVHNVLHLVNDYKLYGSLDLISCFGFESFLGKLKNCVQSGYKPLQQVAFFVWHENDKLLQNISDEYEGASNTFYSLVDDPDISLTCFSSTSAKHFRKAKLQSRSIINTAFVRDSTIIYNGNVGTAVDLVELQQCKYIVLKKFLQVEDLFKKPICSSDVGIYLVDKSSESYDVIELDDSVKKGFLLPYRAKYVALELIHSVL